MMQHSFFQNCRREANRPVRQTGKPRSQPLKTTKAGAASLVSIGELRPYVSVARGVTRFRARHSTSPLRLDLECIRAVRTTQTRAGEFRTQDQPEKSRFRLCQCQASEELSCWLWVWRYEGFLLWPFWTP